MIERLYLENLVSFSSVELEFKSGLIVLTGPSGAGKSLLLSSLLANFGYSSNSVGSLCEVVIKKPLSFNSDAFVFEDEITIKMVKKEKLRYFIDGQNISKKTLLNMWKPYVKYLSVQDRKGLDSDGLIELIDNAISLKDLSFIKIKENYQKRYRYFKEQEAYLIQLKEDEAKKNELIEFANYEIEKIASINPKIGEDEELLKVKQQLSKIDKLKDAIEKAEPIFELESKVLEVYKLLDKDSSFFTEVLHSVKIDFEEAEHFTSELEEIDVKEVLDRLSDITNLKNRYGGIKEALEYKEKREIELLGYGKIEEDKSKIEEFLKKEREELKIEAKKLSILRKEEAKNIENSLIETLKRLKLLELEIIFKDEELLLSGQDNISLKLGNSSSITLSGGEFHRLRLALMSISLPKKRENKGILILDEIDANVSGDESIAIAEVIEKLSKVYQVFAISHQPHLSSKASQHILVEKKDNISQAKTLKDKNSKINEIARIIAGEKPNQEAINFATFLIKD